MVNENYVLVDTENIGSYNSLVNLVKDELKEKPFEIILFQSENSQPIKANFWNLIFNQSSNTKVLKVVGDGSQNMDIQISAYAGYLIGKNINKELSFCNLHEKNKIKIFLYSNDNHFKNCTEFLKSFAEYAEIIFLKEDPTTKNKSNSTEINNKLNLDDDLLRKLRALTTDEEKVFKLIEGEKRLDIIHNKLNNAFANGKGRKIYHLLRDPIKQMIKSKK